MSTDVALRTSASALSDGESVDVNGKQHKVCITTNNHTQSTLKAVIGARNSTLQ